MKEKQQEINHNKINHIMAGETRFKISYANNEELAETEIYPIYNWGFDPKLPENSPHAGQPEK
jgi:hypothetical protein